MLGSLQVQCVFGDRSCGVQAVEVYSSCDDSDCNFQWWSHTALRVSHACVCMCSGVARAESSMVVRRLNDHIGLDESG